MIDFKISILPFIIIFIANFFLSWLYYSPVVPWFKTWQIGIGMDPNITELTEDVKNSMPRLMGGAVIAYQPLKYILTPHTRHVETGTLFLFSDYSLDMKYKLGLCYGRS